ncbi:MAG: hypothetical protein QOE43_2249 [Gaiellaceae bacterium]|jgi:hypothetical protein|nr:hypothetical protein [Gaiellaceae bacterium]
MGRLGRGLLALLAITAAIGGLCVLGGALYAYFQGGTTYAHALAYAMWIGGGLVVLLTGGSGSTTRMAGESRIVVGGRFVQGSDIPMPTSPWVLIPAGTLVIALGALIDVLA